MLLLIGLFLFLDQERIPIDAEEADDQGIPQISLQEMLDDLHIGDDATGGEGAAMLD